MHHTFRNHFERMRIEGVEHLLNDLRFTVSMINNYVHTFSDDSLSELNNKMSKVKNCKYSIADSLDADNEMAGKLKTLTEEMHSAFGRLNDVATYVQPSQSDRRCARCDTPPRVHLREAASLARY